MRKDKESYGYMKYDMKWDPFFKVKAHLTEYLPSWPINSLTRDKIERVSLLKGCCFVIECNRGRREAD